MARVTERNGKLLFDFMYMRLRCREQTTLPDTKENRLKLNRVLKIITAKIQAGVFDYREYFPNSKMADRLDKMDLQRRIMKGKSTPKFVDFAQYWFEMMQPTWRKSTLNGYRNYYEIRIRDYWKDYEVGGISRKDILDFRTSLSRLKARNSVNKLDPSTVNKTLKLFKMIINEAAEQYSFATPYRNIKLIKAPKKGISPFNLDEVNLIVSSIQKHYRHYTTIRFFTGMRTGEINGLKWKNIDFDNRVIKIRETFDGSEFVYTKNDSSQRDIYMSDIVYETLKDQFDKFYEGDDEKTVFTSPTGNEPVNNGNYRKRAWRSVLKKLNIPYRSPYQTRHTTATLWLAAGENPTWIASQMGHANTEMLFKTYARYVPNLTHKDGCAFEEVIKRAYIHKNTIDEVDSVPENFENTGVVYE